MENVPKLSQLQSFCLKQMKFTVWQKYGQQTNCDGFKYQIYYDTSIPNAEQDNILLNNIITALGWAQNDVNLQAIDDSLELLEQGAQQVLWFGFDSAIQLGLIQKAVICKKNNIMFLPSAQTISKNSASKRQAWEMLKPLKI